MRNNCNAISLFLTLFGAAIPASQAYCAAPCQTPCGKSAIRYTVSMAFDAWEHEDWRAMYTYLSADTKKTLSYIEFAKNQQDLATDEKLINFKIESIICDSPKSATAQITLVLKEGQGMRLYPDGSEWRTKVKKEVWKLVKEQGEWTFRLKPPTQ